MGRTDPRPCDSVSGFLDACLHLAQVPSHPPRPGEIPLFHMMASVTVPRHVTFGFGECGAALCFPLELERMNFQELPARIELAWRRGRSGLLEVRDEQEHDGAEAYFDIQDDRIVHKRSVISSLLTVQPEAIRHDQLGYFMQSGLPEGGSFEVAQRMA
ncbi:hypothetical protein [Pelomicrobium sp.]|uniref:hypothetical protein n=1 Tax=Pelomicrobium sp. TaxID=2815319 RepID=UPI002FDCE573